MSYADNFPEYYKIVGFTVFRSLNLNIIQRKTYDVFAWCSDIGGVNEIVLLICSALIS